jgi:hypothetical protein
MPYLDRTLMTSSGEKVFEEVEEALNLAYPKGEFRVGGGYAWQKPFVYGGMTVRYNQRQAKTAGFSQRKVRQIARDVLADTPTPHSIQTVGCAYPGENVDVVR